MVLVLEWAFLVFALASSIIPLIAKKIAGPKYGEYAAWATIFVTCAVLALISSLWFSIDMLSAFVRSVILVALPYGSSLHWIDRTLLTKRQANGNGAEK